MDPGLDDGRAVVCFGLGISQQFSRTRGFRVGRRQIRMGTATSPLQRLIQRGASAYTAGPTIVSARAVCDRLASLGIANAVCYWNRPTDSPLFTTQCYLALLSLLRDLPPHSYLSVKAPAFGFQCRPSQTGSRPGPPHKHHRPFRCDVSGNSGQNICSD